MDKGPLPDDSDTVPDYDRCHIFASAEGPVFDYGYAARDDDRVQLCAIHECFFTDPGHAVRNNDIAVDAMISLEHSIRDLISVLHTAASFAG